MEKRGLRGTLKGPGDHGRLGGHCKGASRQLVRGAGAAFSVGPEQAVGTDVRDAVGYRSGPGRLSRRQLCSLLDRPWGSRLTSRMSDSRSFLGEAAGCGGGGPGCGGELSSHGRAAVVPSRAQPLRPFLIWRACVLPVEFSRCSER